MLGWTRPSTPRPIISDTANPGGKNYILEHPKVIARYRHVTEIPGRAPDHGQLLMKNEDREIMMTIETPLA